MKLKPADPTSRPLTKPLLIAGIALGLAGVFVATSYRGSLRQLFNYPPAARLRLIAVNETNRTVVVADNGSSDRDGRIVEWRLDWGNGQRDVLTNRLIALAHVYEQPGDYLIRLVCVDDLGATNRVPMTLHARIAETTRRPVVPPVVATVAVATNIAERSVTKEEQALLKDLAVQREQARIAFEARQEAGTPSRRLVEELTARKAELAERILAEQTARARAETAVGALRTELANLEMQAQSAHLARLQAEQQVRDLTEQLAQLQQETGERLTAENLARAESELRANELLKQRTNQVVAGRTPATVAHPTIIATTGRALPTWEAAQRPAVAPEKTKAAPDMMRELAKTTVRVDAPVRSERRLAATKSTTSSSVVERTVMREPIKAAAAITSRIEIQGERGRVLPDGRMEVRLSVHGENTGVRVEQWQVGNRLFPRALWLPLSLRAGEHQAKVTVRDDAGRVLTASAVVKVVIGDTAATPTGAVAVQPQ